ncbi:MAG: erythromycin esterase family protein [Polyangiaceae bacterium]
MRDATSEPAATIGKPVAAGVWALDGLPLSLPDHDLAPLSGLVKDAELIGIGENWHTSGDQHATRNRLVRYLVEREGIRLVMLETPWLFATASTSYVAGQSADRAAASHAMFEVFSSTYMAELLDWLRAWNEGHPTDKVQYFGFDVQESSELSGALRKFIEAVDPLRKAELTDALAQCYCGGFDSLYACSQTPEAGLTGSNFPPARDLACRQGLDQLEKEMTLHEGAYAMASSAVTVARAKLGVRNLRAQQKSIISANIADAFEARDQGMHDSILSLREIHAPGKKAVVMAHNGHIAHNQEAAWLKANGYPRRRAMGALLRTTLGTKYRTVGQVAYETKINWGAQPDPKPNTRSDSLERLLHEKQLPYLLLDLHNNEFVKAGASFSFDPQGPIVEFVPSDTFDALVFLDTSAAMVKAP